MKLEKDSAFSLFSPETTLPTEERTQFRSRADDIFGTLSRDSTAPSELSKAMLPPAPPAATFSSVVSDKDLRVKLNKKRLGSGSKGRNFRAQHEINPNKFTKYSLSDTSLTDDSENKAIALDFLKGLHDSKNKEGSGTDTAGEHTEKITFKKPVKEKQTESSTSKRGHQFAVIHEEYVVGQSKPLKPKHRSRDLTKSKGKERPVVTACYLDEDDEID